MFKTLFAFLRSKPPASAADKLWNDKNNGSEAMKEFMTHYLRLNKTNTTSKTAAELYRAVVRAETAKDLILRLPRMRQDRGVLDFLAQIQFLTFSAANWIRRFVEDRYDATEWSMVCEKHEASKLVKQIEDCVTGMFDRVSQLRAESKTNAIAFNAYEVEWKKQDEQANKLALKANQRVVAKLERAWDNAKLKRFADAPNKTQVQLINALDELEDAQAALSTEQQALTIEIKQWMQLERPNEPWRTKGITTLGPFGIHASLPVEFVFLEDHAWFELVQPAEEAARYSAALGGGPVRGRLSPMCPVTVTANDPVADLIRIPKLAKYFVFAYPVTTLHKEVQVENRNPLDSFLLSGGFLYFDADKQLIQTNALWVGCNVQLGAPKRLPEQVMQALEQQNRFHDITLDNLTQLGAKRFAWILPGEFSSKEEGGVQCIDGGWCYQYEDPTVNNYFAIASASSVLGKNKSATLELD